MKVMPQSSATRTAFMASVMSMPRNSAPSDDAPNERIGSSSPVFPSALFFIQDPFSPRRHGVHKDHRAFPVVKSQHHDLSVNSVSSVSLWCLFTFGLP